MRAILIDTPERTVKEINLKLDYDEYETSPLLDAIYDALDIESHLVQIVPTSKFPYHNLLVDEEGMIRARTIQMGSFFLDDFQQPLFGRGIVLGYGREDWIEATLRLDQVLSQITWSNK